MRKPPPRREASLYFRGLPNDLKQMFKAECAKKGKSMREVIEQLMTVYIREGRAR